MYTLHNVLTISIFSILLCRSVEINNTDAEGRLVLGDGVSYLLWR